LLAFLGYLYTKNATRRFQWVVYHLKTDGDALAKAGNTRAAFEKYERILAAIDDRGSTDVEVQKYAVFAKEARDRLYPLVKDELEREEVARREQAEAHRLAAEARAEADRLSGYRGGVSGGAWVENKLGQSDILRGLHVHLIPASVKRIEMTELLGRAKDRARLERAYYEKILRSAHGGQTVIEGVGVADAVRIVRFKQAAEEAVDRVRARADERPIDSKEIYRLCRLTAIGMRSVTAIREDHLWRDAVSRYTVVEAATDIDGKYKLRDVVGGRYYIYAVHSSEFSVVEWLLPIAIDGPGDITCDLYNEKAIEIVNKSDPSS
jgi:hypothetical protein